MSSEPCQVPVCICRKSFSYPLSLSFFCFKIPPRGEKQATVETLTNHRCFIPYYQARGIQRAIFNCFYESCFVKVALFPAASWISHNCDGCCCDQCESPQNRGNKKQGETTYCRQCYYEGEDCFHVRMLKIRMAAGIPMQITRVA